MTVIVKSKYSLFRPKIRSRHPSHSVLRMDKKLIQAIPYKSIVRLGSTTECDDTVDKGGKRIEINSVQAVKNSASKLLMKRKFTEAGVKTAQWWESYQALAHDENIPYPIIAKSHYGSRGVGNTKINSKEELDQWIVGKNLNSYIFEKFIPMTREYRLHVTDQGCFYTCRKLLKADAPEGTWQRHDDVCSWALEENPSFKKPKNWDAIVADCVKAKDALGLDICAFDVMVQGALNGVERDNPEWNICESCSAPSLGKITAEKYIIELPKLIIRKANNS